jgi:hypothetical protein
MEIKILKIKHKICIRVLWLWWLKQCGSGIGIYIGPCFLNDLTESNIFNTDGGRLEETSRRSFQRRLSRFGNSENKKRTDSDEAEVDSHATYRSQKSGEQPACLFYSGAPPVL